MQLISKILSLFGLSKANNNETDEQISQSIESFKNRPIYKELTIQIIDSTSDEDLLQVVFDNLSEKQPVDDEEYEIVMNWNKSRQAIYIIWLLEAEVNNGGYNQFFFNSTGQFYTHLPERLRLVGASRFADLTARANKIFEKENEKITKHQDGTLEGFSKSYEENPLNDLDIEFYALYQKENLYQIQINYIRLNKDDFVDN